MSRFFKRMMRKLSPEDQAVVNRRIRLAGLFSVSYDQKRTLMRMAGFRLRVTREQYINASIRALHLPDTVAIGRQSRPAMSGTLQLTGMSKKYELEYKAARSNGVRMSSTLLEYVNSRRKSDGLPVLSAKEMASGRNGIRFRMQAGSRPEILVFGEMLAEGGFGAKEFVEKLRQFDGASEIVIRINSDGGDPYQALAMYNALRDCPAQIRTVNEGMAASAASLLFMAGDVREMKPASQLMIHEPEVGLMGRADDLRRAASAIDKSRESFAQIYADRSGCSLNYVLQIMKAETYFSPEEAVQKGFATALSS